MFAPLSGKQQREWLKFSAKESRESAKMENDEKRKERLHEIKLQEAAAKANQGIGHKEELHGIKVNELGGPLGKKPRMNREKLGLPSSNPMSGTGMFKQGQHMLAKGTDTVPAMLTPGEAVIPRAAAQDPRNKPLIAQMVQQGRQAQKFGKGTTGVIDIPHQLAMLPVVKPVKKRMGYEDGTIDAQDEQIYNPDKYNEGTMNVVEKDGLPMMHGGYVPHYENGTVDANYEFDTQGDRQGLNPYGLRQQVPAETAQGLDYTMPTPKGSGYMGGMPSADGKMMTEYTMDDNKGQYPSMVPTLGAEELKIISKGQMPDEIDDKARAYRDARVAAGQSPFASSTGLKAPMGYGDFLYKEGQPKPVNIAEVEPAPPPVITEKSQVNNMDRVANPSPFVGAVDGDNMPPIPETAVVESTPRSLTPPLPKYPAKGSPEDRTNPDYWIKHFKGANGDVEKAADRYKNDDKGFIESFKDIFSYKGLKDTLGLNNQEIARMAVMYLGSRARGYNSAKSLSFAGKNAFETSLQRQSREFSEIAADRRAEKSDDRAVRTAAISMASQEQRYQFEDQRAIAKERKDEMTRLTAERRDLRKEYENDRDRFENFASKDVPMSVRNEAFKLAYAPLKSKEPADRIEEQRDNLRKATVLMSMNVQHKDKGNTINMPSPVQPVTLVTNSNGVAVNAMFDPRAPVNQRYTTVDGSPLDMSQYSFKSTEDLNTSKLKSAISSSIPETIKNEKGEDVKNYNKPQLVEATHNVLYNMGMTKANDTQVARIVNDAYQHLIGSKMPINQENLELAIQTNVIKTGANSPLMEVKSDTTNNKNFLSKGNTQQQLEAGHEVGRLAKQAQAANKTLDITPAVMAKNIEDNWADLKKNNPKAYNKFLDDAPLGKSPALEYYKSLIAKQNKKD